MKTHITTPASLLEHLRKEHKDTSIDEEKMDILMKTVKAMHSATDADLLNTEKFEEKRAATEQFSKLIAPKLQVNVIDFKVDGMSCEKVTPQFPHREDTVIMYCHGGGYVSGGLGYARILAGKLAQHTGLKVYSFEYRLAPEHQYPAALEDGKRMWDYLMLKGYGAKNVIIAGDSAGGNMALELCLWLKEEKRMLPKGLVLFSPWTDMRANSPSYEKYKDKDPLLTYEYVIAVRDAYIGKDADASDVRFSPLLADLTGFPPTYIQVGTNEILRNDSEQLLRNLKAYEVNSSIEVIKGGWHVFQQLPVPKATAALEQVNDFIKTIL